MTFRTCPNHLASRHKGEAPVDLPSPVRNKPSSPPGHYQDRAVHNGSYFGVLQQHLMEMWGGSSCEISVRNDKAQYTTLLNWLYIL